jgi:NitT/TauT family transport system substrate-binding protein
MTSLRILGHCSKNVAPLWDRTDLSATYTTQFVENALRAE